MKNVKINFDLEISEDGFPPISVETLNGIMKEDGNIELDNTPFFVQSVAAGDVLKCRNTSDNVNFEFEEVLIPSGNKAISIIFIEDGCKEEVYQYFKQAGCYCEYGEFVDFNMLAVSVDKTMDYEILVSYMEEKEKKEEISYAELCI